MVAYLDYKLPGKPSCHGVAISCVFQIISCDFQKVAPLGVIFALSRTKQGVGAVFCRFAYVSAANRAKRDFL